jgi:hypothetical protein
MALKDGSVYYTKFTHVENGQMLVRRIHRLDVQAGDCRLYSVTGKDLPDGIIGFAGTGVKDAHILQILVPKRMLKAGWAGSSRPRRWPDERDWVNMVVGAGLLMLITGILRLAAHAY